MVNTVFKEKAVADFMNQNYFSYTLDIERGDGPQLKKKYGIDGLPGYVFIDGNDLVVHRAAGAMSTEQFLLEAKNGN